MGRPPPPTPPQPPFHNPFGALERLRADLPAGEAPPAPAAPAADVPARAVLRLERKGRGGREVVVVDQPGLAPGALAAWLADLKQALGCGGTVEGETLVLQGDQRDRIRAWLQARGVRRISG